MRKGWMVVAIVAAFGAGCVNTADSVRRVAAEDLRCPIANVNVQQVEGGAYVARGCGGRSFYIDSNAPAALGPSHRTGHAYVTLAAADH